MAKKLAGIGVILVWASTSAAQLCVSESTGKVSTCPAYVSECQLVAMPKLEFAAESQSGTLIDSSVSVTDVDDRGGNALVYVWFTAAATLQNGQIFYLDVRTQKPVNANRPCN
jgi:hypothetical protein